MTLPTPHISVIMPAYNHQRYVGEAVASVLNQTFGDFELIIIDDGSVDATGRVISKFRDDRIIYLRQENAGAHAALNRGISLARGTYLSLINSDDVYSRERLEMLLGYLERERLQFAFTAVEHIDSNSRTISVDDTRRRGYERLLSRYLEVGDLFGIVMAGNLALTTSNFFFTRSLFDKVGLFSSYRYAHDYDYLLRAFKSCSASSVGLLPERLVKYRRHRNNTISEDTSRVALETYEIVAAHLADFMKCDGDRELVRSVLSNVVLNAGKEVAAITGTRSWRITAPLRWLGEALRLPPTGES